MPLDFALVPKINSIWLYLVLWLLLLIIKYMFCHDHNFENLSIRLLFESPEQISVGIQIFKTQ